jgi:Lrp/AsnC family transcriptional regulator, leucine-responsive regulatory protein
LAQVTELLDRLPAVAECYRVTGDDCFVLKVHLPALGWLDEVLDQLLAHGQAVTSLVQSAPVPRRALPDEAAATK